MKKGIDVSVHQGEIDWKKVKSDSVEFAILRAGYGREISQKDTQFEKNYAGCKANSIPVGAYWYSYALTVDGAKNEAATETDIKKLKHLTIFRPIQFSPGRFLKFRRNNQSISADSVQLTIKLAYRKLRTVRNYPELIILISIQK